MVANDSRSGDLSPRAHPLSPPRLGPATTLVDPEAPYATVLVLDDEASSIRSRLRHTGLAQCDEDPQASEYDPWLDLD